MSWYSSGNESLASAKCEDSLRISKAGDQIQLGKVVGAWRVKMLLQPHNRDLEW